MICMFSLWLNGPRFHMVISNGKKSIIFSPSKSHILKLLWNLLFYQYCLKCVCLTGLQMLNSPLSFVMKSLTTVLFNFTFCASILPFFFIIIFCSICINWHQHWNFLLWSRLVNWNYYCTTFLTGTSSFSWLLFLASKKLDAFAFLTCNWYRHVYEGRNFFRCRCSFTFPYPFTAYITFPSSTACWRSWCPAWAFRRLYIFP